MDVGHLQRREIWMKPLDLFTEKNAGDHGLDHSSSRSLSRELNGLSIRDWKEQSRTLTTKDKMSIASASIALGSPFFLLSIGATFALFDECDNRRIDEQLDRLTGAHRHPMAACPDLAAVDELQSSKHLDESMFPLAWLTADKNNFETSKPKKKKGDWSDQSIFIHDDDRRIDNCSFLAPPKDWLRTDKVLKQKFWLEDELERVNGIGEFSMVAGIIAEIERLDKELKRLGC